MWIIIAGLAFSFLFILFYSINGSSAILIDKKNYRVIIVDKSPLSVIKFTDLIKVDLMVNGARTIVPDVKAKQKFIKKASSVSLKITIAHNDKPVYVNFINNEKNKNGSKYKNAGKKALIFYNKLSEIIDSAGSRRTKSVDVNTSAAFQLKKLNEFKSNIIRQSAS